MNYGLYISAAGLKAQEARQDVIANNLANAQTNGFKRDLAVVQARANAVFEDPRMRQYRVSPFDNQGGGVFVQGGGIDLTQGTMQPSSSPTDVALQGRGFFTVGGTGAAEHGGKLLTRDGEFMINNDGALVTASEGRPVLDDSGAPITLNPAVKVIIDRDGTISQAGVTGARLGVVDVADARKIMKLGGNVLAATDPTDITQVDSGTEVMQNHLENSGVEPMSEMVAMMAGQRAFEANAKMITYQDTMMSEINTIGRVA